VEPLNGNQVDGQPPAGRVRVLVVDDQEPFLAATRAVLSRIADVELAGEARSGEEAIELAATLRPDLVLMDINMGAVDGIEATRQIVADAPQTFVILVSTYPLDDLPPAARQSGARAYINKDELSPAIVRRLWEQGGDPAWSPA
jgi:DNA-binding NarL/FixJ family response regulator